MKKLLSLLLAYAFLQTQSWALSGGPDYGGGVGASVVGTYSGVLTPTSSSPNTLGVFGIVVPAEGLANGAFVYFASGTTYIGVIEGSADPERLVLRALLKAQANITALVATAGATGNASSTLATFPVGFANGNLTATIKAPKLSTSVVRLTGTGSLSVQGASATTGTPTGSVTILPMKVDGFQQTTDTSTTFDLSNFTTTTSGSGGSATTGG